MGIKATTETSRQLNIYHFDQANALQWTLIELS